MEIVACVLIGYVLGCFSPSAILSEIKKVDLRTSGTRNMGATNAFAVLGRRAGVIVLVIDVFKAFLAYHICQALFPAIDCSGLIGGLFAVVGHVFPATMRFKGGKGLASFAGVVLARNPAAFLVLLIACLALMLVVNYSFVVPFGGAIGFFIVEASSGSGAVALSLTAILGAIIVCKHFGNAMRAFRGEDVTVREFLRRYLFKHE